MGNAFLSVKLAWQAIFQDKINLLLALVPVLIGLAFYIFLGKWVFTSIMAVGQEFITAQLGSGFLGVLTYYIATVALTVLLFFAANLTFVLLTSLLASPFNDYLSHRIAKKMRPVELHKNEPTSLFRKIMRVLFFEIKKITIIIIFTFLALTLGYFPLLTPFSVLITAILVSIEFLSFTWDREGLDFSTIKKMYKKNLASNIFAGAIVMVFISIPVLNAFASSFATSYFTILWIKNNESRD